MDDYIAKPVHQRTLVELIEKWGAIGYASAHPQPVAAVDFAHTDVDLLDLDGIREMIEVLGLDAYRDLTEQFFDSHGAAAGDFRDAAASGDYKRLGRLAHSLKGAASNLGLAVLAEQAAALQPTADEDHGGSLDDRVGLTERISTLEAMVEASKQQLLALLDRVPAEWEGAPV
jgi:HPt (histidine-containing phosphotransfer) domain-containing protein